MKTLFLSPLQPKTWGGGGGRGGIPASFPSRSPPPKQPFQPTPTPSPGSRQEVCVFRNLRGWFLWGKGPRPLVGRPQALGARAPSPLETWPTGPWGLDPATLTDFLQAKFLTSCCVSNPWVRVSKRYPQSADLGGRWMVSEGGAAQFHERRFPSSLQHFSRDLANKPLSPASRSRIPKMPRCSSAHEKPGLLHRLISCAQSLQPSLTFLLRRNNKVQGARS